jgi:hypothetical protein
MWSSDVPESDSAPALRVSGRPVLSSYGLLSDSFL